MKRLDEKTLMSVQGGFSLSASFISAIARAYNYVYTFGQSAGSTIRRFISGSYCSV